VLKREVFDDEEAQDAKKKINKVFKSTVKRNLHQKRHLH
jgi:hypothetical protein